MTFKTEVNKNVNRPKENTFYTGNRKENIIMARSRLNCSDLKGHLHNLRITASPECHVNTQVKTPFITFLDAQCATNIGKLFTVKLPTLHLSASREFLLAGITPEKTII